MRILDLLENLARRRARAAAERLAWLRVVRERLGLGPGEPIWVEHATGTVWRDETRAERLGEAPPEAVKELATLAPDEAYARWESYLLAKAGAATDAVPRDD